MKKLLLLGLSLSIGIFTYAQHRNYSGTTLKVRRPIETGRDFADPTSVSNLGSSADVIYNKSGDLLKTPISSSVNAYGIWGNDQRVVSARPEANMVVFGNRGGGPMGATGNDLKVCFSNDLGVNWSNIVVTPEAPNMFRYPSTVVYNPEGNTDPNNMFAIFSGPYTDAIGWKGQYWGSNKLDGSNKNVTYEVNEPTVYLNHINSDLTVTNSGKVHVYSNRLNGTSSAYTIEGWEVLNGTFNPTTNVVDWELPRVKVQPQTINSDTPNRTDGERMAFSPDGSVGYLFGTAADADADYNPYGVEWPIVYKTTDHGQTWEKTEPFDFSQISYLHKYLFSLSADTNVIIPRWYNAWVGSTGNGATVDINGNLHIAGVLMSTVSLHPDSLARFYNEPHLMFDVFMNGDGTWNALFVDTIRTESVASTTNISVGWDQRIRMNRTADGSKVFVTWGDTDPLLWPGSPQTTNLLPDVFIWGWDVENNKITNPVNVTSFEFGPYWGSNFFLHSADLVLEQGNDYLIPCTTSTGVKEADPFTHEYLSGPSFSEAEFIYDGIGGKISTANSFSVNPAYPNPTTGLSVVKVNLDKAATLSLCVYNLTGQKVFEQSRGKVAAGAQELSFDLSNMNAGVYFYTVKAGENSITKKLIVK
jgi:hypothetical protein